MGDTIKVNEPITRINPLKLGFYQYSAKSLERVYCFSGFLTASSFQVSCVYDGLGNNQHNEGRMAGMILSIIFLHPGKTRIYIVTRKMALIFFINNFFKN